MAFLHGGHSVGDGLLAGLAHPLSGLDHVLAMLAVGLLSAQLGRPALWVLPASFPAAMVVGGGLALAGVALPGVEAGVAASVLVLGLWVLLALRAPAGVAAVPVALFAVCHGHAHGAELPVGASGVAYSGGFVLATAALHALGLALGCAGRWSVGPQAMRAAGAAVACCGAFFVWQAAA
jgi:urease accessory protein